MSCVSRLQQRAAVAWRFAMSDRCRDHEPSRHDERGTRGDCCLEPLLPSAGVALTCTRVLRKCCLPGWSTHLPRELDAHDAATNDEHAARGRQPPMLRLQTRQRSVMHQRSTMPQHCNEAGASQQPAGLLQPALQVMRQSQLDARHAAPRDACQHASNLKQAPCTRLRLHTEQYLYESLPFRSRAADVLYGVVRICGARRQNEAIEGEHRPRLQLHAALSYGGHSAAHLRRWAQTIIRQPFARRW